jgi:hypothetical protein
MAASLITHDVYHFHTRPHGGRIQDQVGVMSHLFFSKDAMAAREAGKPLYEARGGRDGFDYGFVHTPYLNTPGLVEDLTRWCDEQFSILGWDRYQGGYWFRTEAHAVAFKLRWM